MIIMTANPVCYYKPNPKFQETTPNPLGNCYSKNLCESSRNKTTVSFTILPEILDCKEFVNADEIAKGLSPFQPEKVAFETGRIMLNRIDELFEQKENFAFETTLATKTYKQKILNA